ncbi:MAG: HigB toxin, RelE-like toxic component of a toxin-antitoxin system, partial [Planctomycetota bacterium]
MRVIAKSRLRFFWESHCDRADAEKCLAVWYKIASSARWMNFASLKQTFGSADR